jgi:NAD(P)-dependent dehydrogenase (short-subunit alcohol dehydrogenase family)
MQPPYPAPVTEWHNDTYDKIDPKRPELSQAGKNIVITGGGSGIGREIAIAFAQAGAANIHILGRTAQSLIETKALVQEKHSNATIATHVADLLDETALANASKLIGHWDVLVANAGYIPKPELIEGSNAEEWWKTFEVLFFISSVRSCSAEAPTGQHQGQL